MPDNAPGCSVTDDLVWKYYTCDGFEAREAKETRVRDVFFQLYSKHGVSNINIPPEFKDALENVSILLCFPDKTLGPEQLNDNQFFFFCSNTFQFSLKNIQTNILAQYSGGCLESAGCLHISINNLFLDDYDWSKTWSRQLNIVSITDLLGKTLVAAMKIGSGLKGLTQFEQVQIGFPHGKNISMTNEPSRPPPGAPLVLLKRELVAETFPGQLDQW